MSARTDTELIQMSAGELAAAIVRGEVSAIEAVEAHIARIEQVNGALNAVVVKRYDEARAEARSADERRARGASLGPVHGVPITIKEHLDLTGTPSTFGLSSRASVFATQDDPWVARLRAAGAIILGKTNVSQLLLYHESDNPVYGRTNNPWNLERSPGGSSGGQAAIIAAGGAPLGLGTDIGGSIRVPATSCGIVGMKPTAGRCDDPGRYSAPMGQRAVVSQVGVLARSVNDAELGLRVISEGGSPDGSPTFSLGDSADIDVAKLRVAYYADDGTFTVAPAVRRAVIEAAGALAGRGAQVTEWVPFQPERGANLFFSILGADGGASLIRTLGRDKRDPRIAQLILLATAPRPIVASLVGGLRAGGQRHLAAIARNFGYHDTARYWRLVEEQLEYRRDFLRALDADDGGPFDVIICPASSLPALRHGASKNLVTAGAYAILYNVLGYPAGIVPVTRVREGEESQRKRSLDRLEGVAQATERGSAGLPVGVQVVARPWQEHLAFAAMRAIESAARGNADYPGIAML
jgi:fatty acid amide hydrolase